MWDIVDVESSLLDHPGSEGMGMELHDLDDFLFLDRRSQAKFHLEIVRSSTSDLSASHWKVEEGIAAPLYLCSAGQFSGYEPSLDRMNPTHASRTLDMHA